MNAIAHSSKIAIITAMVVAVQKFGIRYGRVCPRPPSAFQVVVGGGLVLGAGILIGNS